MSGAAPDLCQVYYNRRIKIIPKRSLKGIISSLLAWPVDHIDSSSPKQKSTNILIHISQKKTAASPFGLVWFGFLRLNSRHVWILRKLQKFQAQGING